MTSRPPPLSDAFRLLVEACRQSFAPGDPGRIEPLLGGAGDLLVLARRHRVQGLAWRGIAPFADRLPTEVHDGLRDDARDIARTGLQSALACRDLLAAHRETGIPLLFLKGLTVGALAYPAPFLKMSSDIDLLVLPGDVERSADILVAQGFRPHLPSDRRRIRSWHSWHKESVWTRPDGLIVELHGRAVSHPALLPELGARSAAQVVEVAPGIGLPTFAPEALFAYLAVHGASSAWFRLKWICDVAGLLEPRTAAEVAAFHRRALELGAARCAGVAIILAATLFTPPWAAAADAIVDSRERALAALALRELAETRAPLDRRFGTVSLRLSQLRLAPGWRSGAAEARRQFTEVVRMRLGR